MAAGKKVSKLHYQEKHNLTLSKLALFLFLNLFILYSFLIFLSLKSRSSFLDSSASVKPVINGKLIVNTKTHMELSELVFSFLKTSQALNFKSAKIKLMNKLN